MFQRKKSLDISAAENSHKTPILVFLENNRKKCRLLQILLGALRVKITIACYGFQCSCTMDQIGEARLFIHQN